MFFLAWFTIGEHYQSTWIGLSDLDRESAFTWSDGSPFAYINWADIGMHYICMTFLFSFIPP